MTQLDVHPDSRYNPDTSPAWLTAHGASSCPADAIGTGHSPAGIEADANDLMRVLQSGRCSKCRLSDADLVHADLRDADLQGAQLQRANLGQARLDGANLKGADLSFTSPERGLVAGADLRGSRLYGTTCASSDLSGARLDPGALEQSHWQGARGIEAGIRSHAALHNAGVDYAQARGELLAATTGGTVELGGDPLCRVNSKTQLASLSHAGRLFEQTRKPSNCAGGQRVEISVDAASGERQGHGL